MRPCQVRAGALHRTLRALAEHARARAVVLALHFREQRRIRDVRDQFHVNRPIAGVSNHDCISRLARCLRPAYLARMRRASRGACSAIGVGITGPLLPVAAHVIRLTRAMGVATVPYSAPFFTCGRLARASPGTGVSRTVVRAAPAPLAYSLGLAYGQPKPCYGRCMRKG